MSFLSSCLRVNTHIYLWSLPFFIPASLRNTPVLLPEKSHGWRSLVGCGPWAHEELDTTGWLHFHFSLSCIGEGNGNPLQGSCLENPRDGGGWWAAICGVAQSWTWLKRLSSSSSSLRKWAVLGTHFTTPLNLIPSHLLLCHQSNWYCQSLSPF